MSGILNKIIGLIAVLLLAGCSSGSSLLDAKSTIPSAAAVPVGNNLALPPDLQLPAPSRTVAGYQPNGYVAPIVMPAPRQVSQAAAFADPTAGNQQTAGQQQAAAYSATETVYSNKGVDLAFPADYYAKYGISRFRANGKLKTPDEMKKQLIAAILAKKRATNPNYGTISNIGNIGAGGDEFIMKP